MHFGWTLCPTHLSTALCDKRFILFCHTYIQFMNRWELKCTFLGIKHSIQDFWKCFIIKIWYKKNLLPLAAVWNVVFRLWKRNVSSTMWIQHFPGQPLEICFCYLEPHHDCNQNGAFILACSFAVQLCECCLPFHSCSPFGLIVKRHRFWVPKVNPLWSPTVSKGDRYIDKALFTAWPPQTFLLPLLVATVS